MNAQGPTDAIDRIGSSLGRPTEPCEHGLRFPRKTRIDLRPVRSEEWDIYMRDAQAGLFDQMQQLMLIHERIGMAARPPAFYDKMQRCHSTRQKWSWILGMDVQVRNGMQAARCLYDGQPAPEVITHETRP
jgi:hypothetical protein